MKNTIDKKGQKQGFWQIQNKAKAFKTNILLIEENYKNGTLHGKRTEIYKEDLFREQFYMNGQLFGETLRNDRLLIQKFNELINSKWKIDKENYPYSNFWFVKCIYEKNCIWVKFDDFLSVFVSEFDMTYREIEDFTKEHFELKVDTTTTADCLIMSVKTSRENAEEFVQESIWKSGPV